MSSCICHRLPPFCGGGKCFGRTASLCLLCPSWDAAVTWALALSRRALALTLLISHVSRMGRPAVLSQALGLQTPLATPESQERDAALVNAAACGSAAEVSQLLKAGANPNAADKYTTALAAAAEKGYITVLRNRKAPARKRTTLPCPPPHEGCRGQRCTCARRNGTNTQRTRATATLLPEQTHARPP